MTSYGNDPHQPGYGQPSGGPPAYGQPAGGPPAYGQPAGYAPQYGGGPPPSRPGGVTAAAVLGFIVGGLATLFAIILFVGGSAFSGVNDGGSGLAGALAGVIIIFAVVVLVVAVIMIWGSVLAISGRSRVLLIVGASLLTAFGLISLLGSMQNAGTDTGGIISQVIGLAISIVIIVLLSLSPASQYFAAERARRGH